jgi:hypothetical protein
MRSWAFKAKSEGKASEDPEVIPLTAWRFMNQTFREFWRAKNGEVRSWRLFQIAFILSQLPAVVSRLDCWKDDPTRMAEEDREATLLYFSTGGGKSESFFGQQMTSGSSVRYCAMGIAFRACRTPQKDRPAPHSPSLG